MAPEDKPVTMDRSDRATRLYLDTQADIKKAVDALDADWDKKWLGLREWLPEYLKETLEHYVSYKALIAFLLTLAGVSLTAGIFLFSQVKGVAEEIRKENGEAKKEQAAQLKAQTDDIAWIRSKVDGSESLKKQMEKAQRKKEKAP